MKEFWKSFALIGPGVLLLWLGWWWLFGLRVDAHAEGFAGIDSLFSGLALAGVITAVVLQSKELQLQREEMRLSREETQKTALANQEAAAALARQADAQLRAAELSAVGALLNSVNSQLGSGASLSGVELQELENARGVYHNRVHEILAGMDRGL